MSQESRKRALLTPSQPCAKRLKRAYEDSSKKIIKEKIKGSYNIINKIGKEIKKVWKLDDFEIGRKLGTGKFAKVYLAREKESGFIVALKVLEIERLNKHGAIHTAKNEILIMNNTRHENILRLFAFFWDDKRVYLVLEYAGGGELFDAIHLKGGMTKQQTAKIISDLASALLYCHKKRILHRDIKPENLLLDSRGLIKLADFGYAIHSAEKRKTFCGTAEYLPPEIVNRSSYTARIDVWALGVLTYELLSGRAPFEGETHKEIFQKIKASKENLKFPDYFSESAKNFISQLLKKKPAERLGLDQVNDHAFIQENLTEAQKQNYRQKTPKRKKVFSTLSPTAKNTAKNSISLLQPPAPTSKILVTPEGKKTNHIPPNLNSQDVFYLGIKQSMSRDICDSPVPTESFELKNFEKNTETHSTETTLSFTNDQQNDSLINTSLLNDSLESRPENDLDIPEDIKNTTVDDFQLFSLFQDTIPADEKKSLLPSQTVAYQDDSDDEVAFSISQGSMFQSASLI